MRAVRLIEPGRIEVGEAPDPVPREGDALVRVHAAALTRDELDWPLDRLPAVPSYEISGTVGGDEVYALLPFDRDGGAAELTVAHAALLAPKPKTLDHVHAAALPLAGLSAWQGLFDHGGLRPGERVHITGAGGGVGHLAVQLARWAGAEVVEDDADLVFDTAGGEALSSARAARIVSVAEEAPGAVYFVVEPNREQLVELARLADEGAVVPQIDSTFPLAEAEAAFDRLAQRGKRGKVVLEV